MKPNKLIVVSFIALMFIAAMVLPIAVQASSGSGVSPGSLVTSVERGKTAQLEITVFNYEPYAVEYNVYVDDAPYFGWVTFDHPTFTLAAGEHQKVTMTINAPADGKDSNNFYVRVLPTAVETEGTPLVVAYKIPTSVGLTDPASNVPDDKSGGIPPEWVLLSIVAVIVIAVAGYWVYKTKAKGEKKGKE